MKSSEGSARKGIRLVSRMTEEEFNATIAIAIARGDIANKEEVSFKKSGHWGLNFVLKDENGKILTRVDEDVVDLKVDPSLADQFPNLYKKDNSREKAEISKEELENERQVKQEEIENRRLIEKESFDKKVSEGRIKLWDYKHIRLDYKGRGITQEINILDIDGERIRGWTDNFSSNEVPTLPELFEKLGNEGWEMISHVVNQDITQNGVTLHYYNFKREKL